MIEEAAAFIEVDDEHCALPGGAGYDRVVDTVEKDFAVADVAVRMIVA